MSKLKRTNTEEQLFKDVANLIEESRQYVAHTVNTTLSLLYWKIGKRINSEVLNNKRAEYGKQIVASLTRQLVETYGRGWDEKNDPSLSPQCGDNDGWTHIKTIMYLKDDLQREFYMEMCLLERWSTRKLQEKIDGMLYERTAISKKPKQLIKQEIKDLRENDTLTPDLVFRDPYFLDFLGLKNTFSEKNLEDAILRELESFILELGQGFSFVERQKRMVIDGDDFKLDLLFYHRKLKRLVAIDLKLGKFKAAYKAQMELYLRWLEKNEMQKGEQTPIGLLLCAEGNKEQIELLQLNKAGIKVAEYLTELPSKKLLQQKLHQAIEISKNKLKIMGEWKKYYLGEAAELITGFPFKGDKYEMKGNLKVVRGENVTLGTLRWDSEKYWNYSVENIEKYFLNPDDIVIGMDGSRVGQNRAIIRENELPLILAQRVARLRAKNKFDQKFIWYQIYSKRFTAYVEAIQTGTSIPHISPSQIKDFEILAPDYKEQKAISETISSLDDKIDLLHRQNKTLEQLAETLFRQWFVEEVEESWEIVRISDVAEINSRTISKNYLFSEIEYLDTGSITEGIIAGFQTHKLAEAPSRAQRIIKDNDIVYSLVRPIQRHYGLLNGIKQNAIASTGFCVITCSDFSPHFLYILLTSSENIDYFDMIAEGATSTYPSLKPSDIANFEFPKPPEEILNRFSRIAFAYWDKIKSNTNQIRTLTQLRDTLLPKLMSGEMRVK